MNPTTAFSFGHHGNLLYPTPEAGIICTVFSTKHEVHKWIHTSSLPWNNAMYYTGVKSLRLAFVGRNFGADAEFAEYDEQIGVTPVKVRMPMAFLFGAAIDLFEY